MIVRFAQCFALRNLFDRVGLGTVQRRMSSRASRHAGQFRPVYNGDRPIAALEGTGTRTPKTSAGGLGR